MENATLMANSNWAGAMPFGLRTAYAVASEIDKNDCSDNCPPLLAKLDQELSIRMHFAQYFCRLIVDRQFETESLTRIDERCRTNEQQTQQSLIRH